MMETFPLTLLDIGKLINAGTTDYANIPVAMVNDHVIRISIMTENYYWHYHPNSDETFIGIEGVLLIDLETETIELAPGQLFTIPKSVVHRTRPMGSRSVNLTVEHGHTKTVRSES